MSSVINTFYNKRCCTLQTLIILLTLSSSWPFRTSLHRIHRPAKLYASSTSSVNEIYILSFDGVLADSSEFRANMGIEVALETWPFLMKEQPYRSLILESRHWLLNKMVALSHVLQSDRDALMGCDNVLLARLLLEEQILDQGRSDGSMGKYGSRFHPRISPVFGSQKNQGSRPLTVGEISANWIEGACLRDTIRAKYNIDRKDPIPIIKKHIVKFLTEKTITNVPKLNPSLSYVLNTCSSRVYLLVGHPSHVPIASECLSQLHIHFSVINRLEDISSSPVHIVALEKDHLETVRDLIYKHPNGSRFSIVHSSLFFLKKLKWVLFSDDSPTLIHGYGPCVKIETKMDSRVKLCLPQWAENVSYKQENDAEMDPWLHVVSEDEVSELLSARIISVGENKE